MGSKIQELPKSSSRLLTSSQIITSIFCVAKELIENALDSSAKNVEVKLEDYGLEKIEVKDNGCGIDEVDIQFVAKSHFTSKISTFADLEKVESYGFRGEALSAICAVADVAITTNSTDGSIGHFVNFNHEGQVTSTKSFPCACGTTISVKNLFENIPVRKQYYRSEKRKKEDLHKIEDLLIAFGCIQNDVRFVLYHNKNMIWQKPSLSSTKNALIHVLGKCVVDNLEYKEYIDKENQRKIEMFLPKADAPLTCGLTSLSRCLISINHRPVRMKAFDKLLKEYYNKGIHNLGKTCYPICFISFIVPLTEVDANVEPNKTVVMLHHSEEILSWFSEILKNFYSTENDLSESCIPPESSLNGQSLKSNATDFLNSLKVTCETKIPQSRLQVNTDSYVSPVNHCNNKDANVRSSVEVTSTPMSKRDINVIGTPKEPSKKKLKSMVSKSDMDNHINTLKNFFAREEINSVNKLSDNPLSFSSEVPRITIQKMSSSLNDLSPAADQIGFNMNSERVTTFAVSSNMSCNDHFSTNRSNLNSYKRHLSESSIFAEKDNDDAPKRPALDLDCQNGDAWSRGINPSGELVQPVKVLQSKTVDVQNGSTKDNIGTEKKKEACQQKISFERKITAFDIFCRNNRLEVAAQNPDSNNQQIAQMLSEKWNRLSPEEKAVFKNMIDRDYPQSIKTKEKLGKIVKQNLSQASSHKAVEKKNKCNLKEKNITFNFELMKSAFQNKNKINSPSKGLNLINYLARGIWICAKEKKLFILNTFRLQESIIYNRLLETFHFEFEPLNEPKTINSSQLGQEGMEILLHLCNLEADAEGRISDERLTANGFDVKFVKGENNDISVELAGMTNSIAFYGIPDLKEILLLLRNKNFSAKLSECRPGKVILYLESEANRILRQSPACQRVQDAESLLKEKSHLPSYCEKCIHHKPFFNELFEIPL